MCTSPDIFRHHLKTHYFQQALKPTSCTSDSALAGQCARLQIILAYLFTYTNTSQPFQHRTLQRRQRRYRLPLESRNESQHSQYEPARRVSSTAQYNT